MRSGSTIYWAGWCLLQPTVIAGPIGLARRFGTGVPLSAAGTAVLVALVLPLVLAYGCVFPRVVTAATPAVIALSAVLAVNRRGVPTPISLLNH